MHAHLPAVRVQGDGGFAETPADLDVTADQAGWDRVAVPPQRHERVRRDGADLDDLGRERNAAATPSNGSASASSPTVDPSRRRASAVAGAPRVERRLGLGRCGDAGGSPPRLGQVVDRLLDHALAVPVPRRARVDPDAVVLGDRSEAPLDLARSPG